MIARESHPASIKSSGPWMLGVDRSGHIASELQGLYSELIDSYGAHLAIALEMLGGPKVFTHVPENRLEVHHWVSQGIPSAAIFHLASAMDPMPSTVLSEALGISIRTLHRKKGTPGETLTVAQGGRTFKFAEVVAKAAVILGSREGALQWLTAPAIGLDQQKPIDLLATPVGTQLVEELLGRIEHGIYA